MIYKINWVFTSTLGGGGGGGAFVSILVRYETDSFAPGCWPELTALFIISKALWKLSKIKVIIFEQYCQIKHYL